MDGPQRARHHGLPAVYVSLSYRLAPDHAFPTPLDDCLTGLAFVRDTIARHGGDPNRVFVGALGRGHLAALLTLRRDLQARHGLAQDFVKGCFPYSASNDLTMPNADGDCVRVPSTLKLLPQERADDVADAFRRSATYRQPQRPSW